MILFVWRSLCLKYTSYALLQGYQCWWQIRSYFLVVNLNHNTPGLISSKCCSSLKLFRKKPNMVFLVNQNNSVSLCRVQMAKARLHILATCSYLSPSLSKFTSVSMVMDHLTHRLGLEHIPTLLPKRISIPSTLKTPEWTHSYLRLGHGGQQ